MISALPLFRVKGYEIPNINGKDKKASEARLVIINPPATEMVNIETTEPGRYRLLYTVGADITNDLVYICSVS